MAILRKKVNQASLAHSRAKGASRVETKKKLEEAVKKRGKGLRGFTRVMASPATERLIKLKKYQIQKAREVEQNAKKGIFIKKLDKIHPSFKGISTRDRVLIKANGQLYKGMIVDAFPDTLWLKKASGEIVTLKMKEVNGVELQKK
ncbi:MAG: hypothetical protein ACOX1V_00975 [Candidatus Iainarchaeum sp.]|jgi:hypothetical protein|nr:MAG: hypothetical protein BWY55_00037 [archaeon ADurb.Bin336]